ncbi:MAG TPA: hypothetical protein ENJ09_09610, partial [Planctomycetes bacterium]|nr:hypothetical protein [Planctomycetota bacterium]
EPLGAFLGESGQSELEELFVRTFENNKERALELGWHLHGENYARGSFMARVRGLLRELGVEESIELPDHVSHLLAVVERAEPDVARSFATRVIDPALTKVLEGFHSSENPYRGVVRSLRAYLRTLYPEQSPIQVGSSSHE